MNEGTDFLLYYLMRTVWILISLKKKHITVYLNSIMINNNDDSGLLS